MRIETNFNAVKERRREAMADLERIVKEEMFKGCPTPIDIKIDGMMFVAQRDGDTVKVAVSDGVAEFRTELTVDDSYPCQLGYVWDAMETLASDPYSFDMEKAVGL